MTRPSRDTAAGRAYLDLQAVARHDGRPTDELVVLFILERFLYRLSVHRARLVLKGGMLLAAFDERRPTRDVDLLALATQGDIDTVAALVREVLTVEVDDGVVFDGAHLTARAIREHEIYAGVRVIVPARVDRARHPLRVDVNVGDPVTPALIEVDFPALLGGRFPVAACPIDTVLAEKIVTMIDPPPPANATSPTSCCWPGGPPSTRAGCLRPSTRPLRTVAPTCGPFGRYS